MTSTHRESISFKGTKETVSILEESDPLTYPACVTQRADFGTVCLHWAVLLVSLHSHHCHRGSSDVPDGESRLVDF